MSIDKESYPLSVIREISKCILAQINPWPGLFGLREKEFFGRIRLERDLSRNYMGLIAPCSIYDLWGIRLMRDYIYTITKDK